MMMPMQKPTKVSWEEYVEQLDIQIANSEKQLLMAKAQRKEAQSHIKEQ